MIDFRQLRGVMASAFDTDNLVSVTDTLTNTVTAENVPCHFVITQVDNPGTGETVAEKPVPVVVYGEIYTSETPIIREGDAVVIEKKDTAGNVIATYEGRAGMPAYRAGRMVTVMKITAIKSEEEPEPTGGFNIIVPNGLGGTETSADKYAVEEKKIDDGAGGVYNVLSLLDIRFEVEGSAVYLEDDGLGGRVKLFPYAYSGYIKFTDGVTTYSAYAKQTPGMDGGRAYVTIG